MEETLSLGSMPTTNPEISLIDLDFRDRDTYRYSKSRNRCQSEHSMILCLAPYFIALGLAIIDFVARRSMRGYSAIGLGIILCGAKIKSLSVRTDTNFDFYCSNILPLVVEGGGDCINSS
jgi:hypothetical protein